MINYVCEYLTFHTVERETTIKNNKLFIGFEVNSLFTKVPFNQALLFVASRVKRGRGTERENHQYCFFYMTINKMVSQIPKFSLQERLWEQK